MDDDSGDSDDSIFPASMFKRHRPNPGHDSSDCMSDLENEIVREDAELESSDSGSAVDDMGDWSDWGSVVDEMDEAWGAASNDIEHVLSECDEGEEWELCCECDD